MSTTNGQTKISKLELKKQRIYLERRQRYINQGMSVEAANARIQAEDYKALPVDKKIVYLEALMNAGDQALANDIRLLQENDVVIAKNMDINFGAISDLLEEMGVTKEKQIAAMKASTERYEAEMARRAAADKKDDVKVAEEQVLKDLEKEIGEEVIAGKERSVAAEELPEGATEFKG